MSHKLPAAVLSLLLRSSGPDDLYETHRRLRRLPAPLLRGQQSPLFSALPVHNLPWRGRSPSAASELPDSGSAPAPLSEAHTF